MEAFAYWNALTVGHMCWVEILQERLGFPPLATNHHILARLVPEVVPKGRGMAGSFPVPFDGERGPID